MFTLINKNTSFSEQTLTIFRLTKKKTKHKPYIEIEPGIGKGEESNLVDPEEAQHCPTGSQKDHLVIQPTKYKQKKQGGC